MMVVVVEVVVVNCVRFWYDKSSIGNTATQFRPMKNS